MHPEFSSGFKKILSNTGYLAGEKVFNMILSLLVGIWVARYLGPEDYGLWQYASSLVGLVTALATLGTTQIVIRDLVNEPKENEGSILGTSFLLMIVAGSITAIAIIGIGFWFNDESVTRWLIVISSVNLILISFNAFDYWFQSKVLSKYSVFARTGANLMASVLKVLFIILTLSVIYFALAVIIGAVVKIIIWLYSYKKENRNIYSWNFDANYAKEILKDSWPLIISGLSVAIYMKIDQVMLKSMVDASAVGNYAVAVKISELWYFIPIAIASSVYPTIIKSKKENIEKYYKRLQYLYDMMAGMAVVIAVPMTFLSNPLIKVLFGPDYSMAGGVLAIHIWAGIFVFLGVARSKWIINENYQFYGMIFTISGAISNVILNIWLIPLLGIIGAAWATVISYIISAWASSFFISKTRIAFKMQGKSIIKAFMIVPVYQSLKHIYNESKKD